MNAYAGTAAPPGGMYVRALYDYDADDRTSLSFRQGEVIQVITQLESGWWDGIINNVRGWFPSNYCQLLNGPVPSGHMPEGGNMNGQIDDSASSNDGTEEYEDAYEEDFASESSSHRSRTRGTMGSVTSEQEQEEAAFWIPQATPDGRLYYFNTLTGVSTMELPLETPTSNNETGPRDRTNVFLPESTRPPPEIMAGGRYEREDDMDYDNSASENERSAVEESTGSLPFKRVSYLSNGVSPATSMDSMKQGSSTAMSRSVDPNLTLAGMPPLGTTMTSFANSPLGPQTTTAVPRHLFDDVNAVPLTWNRSVEDMRRSVERYRQAIEDGQRSEFVRRAEDISDHLRLLLAAGSGTTDNHSGNPSIISTNKALYPHFRETMSRFSKLVLSSHIAAADFPPPDSYAKCLKEAEGVLNGVYGFVEVARQQRGEKIPRLIPGFISNSYVGGSWRNNGLSAPSAVPPSPFPEQDDFDTNLEPNTRLDMNVLERLSEVKGMVEPSLRRLEEQLLMHDKIITPLRHRVIGDNVCKAAKKVIEIYRPFMSTIQTINLAPLGPDYQNPNVVDFYTQFQRLHDMNGELVMACQSVCSPLADEWSEIRGDSLEDRLRNVSMVVKGLRVSTSQIYSTLQLLSEIMPMDDSAPVNLKQESRKTDSGIAPSYDSRLRSGSNPMKPDLLDRELGEGLTPPELVRNGQGQSRKIKEFFGDVPQPMVEDTPKYLRLDHEGEIMYDTKSTPPLLRGGTLNALVEQLTRHDRLDSGFNGTFLLTYKSFTSANELFEMLVRRWSIQPPEGLSQEDYQVWVDKKQKLIQFRVVNILKSWFDSYWMEPNDEDSKALIQRVHTFAKDFVATTNTPGAAPLIQAIEQRMRGVEAPAKRLVLTLNQSTPAPILPKNMRKLKFLDIDATEFARQLTIVESRLYGKIKATECLNKTWQRKLAPGEADPASNMKGFILHSNQLTNWVAQMILNQADVKRRVIVIKHFVGVADKCRQLNNFSTLTSIISALSTAPIHRLQRTWQQVNGKTKDTLEQMRKLMGSTRNFAEYRDTIHKANPPCVPFLGVYLTDLTFIEDGIPGIIKKTTLINFAKRAKTAEVIRDIQQYQNVPYPLQPVPELQEYILSNMRQAGDVHEMYEMSLQVEPREREDEKIARLLSESGFL
ncbi:guanine-nucleotide dissociation stimulator CDC25 [Tothia fuscella]|uniref:Class E vacuolar protein-sorting machinery protein HSE1 n=1 Tax=Tothia fuscella TaxID=1048955 RepID=A0A9P4TXZ5_9PEZI|nr:guanine-nucleotide dissociation stimulator CDC25 [Tothia fuscella]